MQISAAAAELHRETIVIDGTCPLLRRKEFVDWYIEGGVTACAPTVGSTAPAEETLRNLGAWHRLIAARKDLVLVERAAQIPEAKKEKKLGLVFHFQGAPRRSSRASPITGRGSSSASGRTLASASRVCD